MDVLPERRKPVNKILGRIKEFRFLFDVWLVPPPPESVIVDVGSIMNMQIWKRKRINIHHLFCCVVCVFMHKQKKLD